MSEQTWDIEEDEVGTEESDWQSIADAYISRLDKTSVRTERVRILRETAEIFEVHLDDVESAYTVLQKAITENPAEPNTLSQIEGFAERHGLWAEVYSFVNQSLPYAIGKHSQISLILRLGAWCSEKLDRDDVAFSHYQAALELDTTDPRAYDAIAGLYRKNQQWQDLADVLEKAAGMCGDSKQSAQYFLKRGNVLHENLASPADAIASYELAFETDPEFFPALDAIAAIHERTENHVELAQILTRKTKANISPEDNADLHSRLGDLYLNKLDDPELAIDHLKEVLSRSPDSHDTMLSLEHCYQRLGRFRNIHEILEAQTTLELKPDQLLDVYLRLADLCEFSLSDYSSAAAAWERILELAPEQDNALVELVRLYRKSKNWAELVSALEKKISLSDTKEEKSKLELDRGCIALEELKDYSVAEEAFQASIAHDGPNKDSLLGLSKALEFAEKWLPASQTLESLLKETQSESEKIEALERLALIQWKHLDSPKKAVSTLERAIELSPQNISCLSALREIQTEREEWEETARLLEIEQSLCDKSSQRAELCYKLGIALLNSNSQSKGMEWFEKALELHPQHLPAAHMLSGCYISNEQWSAAEPLLEMLLRLDDKEDAKNSATVLQRMAQVKQNLGKHKEALDAAKDATQLARNDLDTIRVLADASYDSGEWQEALKSYTRLIGQIHKQENDSITVDLLFRIANARYHLGSDRHALSNLKKALELIPEHRPSLELIVEAYGRAKRVDEVVKYKQRLARILPDSEKLPLYEEMGKLYSETLDDPTSAVKAYESAIQLTSDERPLLHLLLPLYQKTEKWTDLVNTLDRIIKLATDPVHLARYEYSKGLILREKLLDPEKAYASFNKSLDSEPNDETVFAALISLTIEAKNGKMLDDGYRQMIRRMKTAGKPDRQLQLWQELGEKTIQHLNDFEAATICFETARTFDPDSKEIRDKLISCYMNTPSMHEDAIFELRSLIREYPKEIPYFKLLGSMLAGMERHDEAWCVTGALVEFGCANSKERALYEQKLTKQPPSPRGQLSTSDWSDLIVHPWENRELQAIFKPISTAVSRTVAKPMRSLGIKRKMHVEPNDGTTLSQRYSEAETALYSGNGPELFSPENGSPPLSLAPTDPPVGLLGQNRPLGADFAGYSPEAEQVFAIAKFFAHIRPGTDILWYIPSLGELKLVTMAALVTCDPQFPIPSELAPGITPYVERLASWLSPDELDELHTAVRAFPRDQGVPSISKWVSGLEYTACRTALLMTGDLPTTVEIMKNELSPVSSRLSLRKRLKDLRAFNVSFEYAQLRKRLGFSTD